MQPASRFCALRGVRVSGGDLCRLWAAEAPTEPTGETERLFEKALSAHSAKLYCVTNRDDGDDVLSLCTLLKYLLRSSHIDTPIS